MKGRNNARAVKSSTVVIFEDPKSRVVSLLIEAHDDDWKMYDDFFKRLSAHEYNHRF